MDTREGTEMIEKGELIVGEINMGRGPINLVPVDVKTVRIRESPVDVRIVPILEDDRLQSKGKAPTINRPQQGGFLPRP